MQQERHLTIKLIEVLLKDMIEYESGGQIELH